MTPRSVALIAHTIRATRMAHRRGTKRACAGNHRAPSRRRVRGERVGIVLAGRPASRDCDVILAVRGHRGSCGGSGVSSMEWATRCSSACADANVIREAIWRLELHSAIFRHDRRTLFATCAHPVATVVLFPASTWRTSSPCRHVSDRGGDDCGPAHGISRAHAHLPSPRSVVPRADRLHRSARPSAQCARHTQSRRSLHCGLARPAVRGARTCRAIALRADDREGQFRNERSPAKKRNACSQFPR